MRHALLLLILNALSAQKGTIWKQDIVFLVVLLLNMKTQLREPATIASLLALHVLSRIVPSVRVVIQIFSLLTVIAFPVVPAPTTQGCSVIRLFMRYQPAS